MNDKYLYTSVSTSPLFHDLRPVQDDRTVLTNPHKGWYIHFVDNGMRFPLYRSTLKEGEDLKFLPGLNHLYLRIDWSDVEPEEGHFTWEKVDEIIEEWGAKGYRFAIRLCACEKNRSMIPYATPKWMFDAGLPGRTIEFEMPDLFLKQGFGVPGEKYFTVEPNYGHPLFLEKFENLMKEYGRKYNGHPLIDFIDVGSFGPWGEGHSEVQYSPEVVRAHIDMHLRYFPDTFVLVNDDMIKHCGDADEVASQELVHYCREQHMGLRDDSLYVPGYCTTYGYDTLAIPTAFDHFWRNAPVDLESGHQTQLTLSGVMDGGFRGMEALRRTHATYTGFHGNPYEWYEQHAVYHDYIANRLGYWYFVEGFTLPQVMQGISPYLTLFISNRGFAPAYHRYDLRILAVDGEGKEFLLSENAADNRQWMCGETAEVRLRLKTETLAKGRYQLYVGLFCGERAVQFGMKAERKTEAGYYLLGDMDIA